MKKVIVFDSQCYSYLLEVLSTTEEPSCSLAVEKMAMIRIFFYVEAIFSITNTVQQEYMNITDKKWRDFHQSTHSVLINDLNSAASEGEISKRAENLMCYHKKEKDCQILAEAEFGGADYLLTYDMKFRNRLSGKARGLKLLFPSTFYAAQCINPGETPLVSPHLSNPLSKVSFWRV